MLDAMFQRDGMQVRPGPLCTGPWDPNAMHGGPPTVLAGRYLADHGDGGSFHLARLTVELVRPVPLVPLTIEIAETRPGRRIQLLDLVLRDATGTELVYARAMRIARGENGLDEAALDLPGPIDVLGPESSTTYDHGYPLPAGGFYMDAFDIRTTDGRSFGEPGPSAAWFRLLAPVFEGEPITPLERVLSIADFGNGISNIVEMGSHRYINPDLTVNVHRLPQGEWLVSDAVTHVRSDGYGTATATIGDADGRLAIANQSLLVVSA
ncbi:MAG: thioesterase family protein [Actinomycetota bacterium]